MANKQIYKFPLKEKIPLKAALYLFGHGPYREPRIIEMQYFRILRYCEALEEKLEIKIDIKEIYIDINFPRTEDLEKLTNLQALLNDVKKQKIDTVIVDICQGDSFHLKSARILLLQSFAGRSPTISGGGIAVRYGMVR